MLDKSLEEEKALSVDERLARVVRIIVEHHDGDVKAFVDSNRYRTEVNRKAERPETPVRFTFPAYTPKCETRVDFMKRA